MNKTIRNSLALAIFATATACSSTETTTTITGTTTTSYTTTSETGTTTTKTGTTVTTPEDDYITPYTFSLATEFGYDAATGTINGYWNSGYEMPAAFIITIHDERYWTSDYNAMYTCDIVFTIPNGTVVPSWVGEDVVYSTDKKGNPTASTSAFIGIDFAKSYEVTETCGLELDPMSGFSTAAEVIANSWIGGVWNLGFADMSTMPDLESALMANITDSGGDWANDYAPFMIGGGMIYEEKGVDYFADMSYGYVYETNDALDLQFDAKGYANLVQAAQVISTLPTALYTMRNYYGYYLN